MNAPAGKPNADKHIQIRVQSKVRALIDRAAAVAGKSRSEFMIECAQAEAISVLLDQRYVELEGQDWDKLMAILARPPMPNAALKTLIRSRAPWE